MVAILTIVGAEVAAAALMFWVMTPVASWIPPIVGRILWIALWAICFRVLFNRTRSTPQVVAVVGRSFGLGAVCLLVSALAIAFGIVLAVAAYVNLGGQL